MLICDDCMNLCYIEGHFVEPIITITGNTSKTCELCLNERWRFYEMEKEHMQELMRRYRQLLNELDLTKLLDQ